MTPVNSLSLVRFDGNDYSVPVRWAHHRVVIAGIFHLFDGAQVVSMGALRGLKDVRVPAILIAVTYWGVALPLGATLCFAAHWGAFGFWTGLATGLAIASLVLSARVWKKLRC